MKTKKIALIIVLSIMGCVVSYGAFLIFITSPISEYSISNAGAFGDSFGLLTSLFSGLAFAGVIITVLLQREELQLQRIEISESRKEFSRGATAQARGAQLSALNALLNECIERIKENEEKIESPKRILIDLQEKVDLREENELLYQRKNVLIYEIEQILKATGIRLDEET